MSKRRRAPKPMEFYTTVACCAACKDRHGFFAPMICGHNNGSGRDVWYDRVTCTWTIDSPVTKPSPDTFERLGEVAGRVVESADEEEGTIA